ncbi:MAG: flagellar hook protein FlgE [Legionellaceae bacterium]|nr:flagellar hook protein FlgE [Legionellaceae bacterium]
MAFNTGLSGIQAASKDLDVIGNNIANSATVGFKSSRAEFADVYAVGAYGGGSNAIGSGVRLANVQQTFGQGNLTFTNNVLDLAVSGSGLFVLNDQGTNAYSRAGAFTVNNEGEIVNAFGQNLIGRQADANGNILQTQGNMRVDMANIAPRTTSLAEVGLNLFANAAPPTVEWSGGASPASDSYNNVTSATVYDSLGNSHVLSMYFIRADDSGPGPNGGDTNQWYVAFQIDNQDVPAVVAGDNADKLFRANFASDGTFVGVEDSDGTPLANNFIPLSWNPQNGANPMAVNLDLSNTTQFGSPFGVQSLSQDGYTTGQVNGLDIDQNGVLFARYTNGQNRAMGQLMLANFSNLDGLQQLGNTSWAETAASGMPLIGEPGTASLGLIQSGALEESNVDITEELIGLIGAQRNFQANSQTIRTADAVTQTIINIR